jgi:hypothetical protein
MSELGYNIPITLMTSDFVVIIVKEGAKEMFVPKPKTKIG